LIGSFQALVGLMGAHIIEASGITTTTVSVEDFAVGKGIVAMHYMEVVHEAPEEFYVNSIVHCNT
jgi:hypothetical protein